MIEENKNSDSYFSYESPRSEHSREQLSYPTQIASFRKSYDFYCTPAHQETARQIENGLILNEKFKARLELAEAIKETISNFLCQENTTQPKLSNLLSVVNSVLNESTGSTPAYTPSTRGNPVYGATEEFPIPALLCLKTSVLNHKLLLNLKVLTLAVVTAKAMENFNDHIKKIRLYVSDNKSSPTLLSIIPACLKEEEISASISLAKKAINSNKLQGKAKDFVHATLKLLEEYLLLCSEKSESSASPASCSTKRWISNNQRVVSADWRCFTLEEKRHLERVLLKNLHSADIAMKHAAALVSLIYITGQTIETVFMFEIGDDGDLTPDGFYQKKITQPPNAYSPKTALNSSTLADTLQLRLPPALKEWIVGLNCRSGTLLSAVSLSQLKLNKAIGKLLIEVRKLSAYKRIRLDKIPASLSIELFLCFRDETLVHLIARKPNQAHPNLSYYISHDIQVVQRAYETVVCQLLPSMHKFNNQGRLSSSKKHEEIHALTKPHPCDAEVIKFQKQLVNEIEKAKKSKTIISLHNAYTDYCMALLLLASGHRIVLDPFALKSHFSKEGNMLSISDKIRIEENAWRIVSLPDIAKKQLELYLKYIEALSSKLHQLDTHKKLAAQIKNHHANDDGFIPLFFFLDVTKPNQAISVSNSMLTERWKSLWQWPPNILRHILATQLNRRSKCGELTKIQLGHSYDSAHAFGRRASFCPTKVFEVLSGHIESMLDDFGFNPIKSPIRQTGPTLRGNVETKPRPRALGPKKRLLKYRAERSAASAFLRELANKYFKKSQLRKLTKQELAQLKSMVPEAADNSVSEPKCFDVIDKYSNKMGPSFSHDFSPRKEPSPFTEKSLVYYQDGIEMRERWMRYLNSQFGQKPPSVTVRYAEIIVSAAILGGLLNTDYLAKLHLAIASNLHFLNHQFVVDFSSLFEKNSKQFTWRPDKVTEGLIVGLIKLADGKLAPPKEALLLAALQEILDRIGAATSKPFLYLSKVGQRLATIELPGFIREFAKGKTVTACLPIESLVRINTNQALKEHRQKPHTNIADRGQTKTYWLPSCDVTEANGKGLVELKKELAKHRKAANAIPFGSRKSRNRRLKEEYARRIEASFGPSNTWSTHSGIIAGFIVYMVNEGTMCKKDPAFSTIESYSALALEALLRLSPKTDLFALKESDWEELYSSFAYEKKCEKACTAIYLFHHYLCEKYAVEEIEWPSIYATAGIDSCPTKTDANFITEKEYLDLLSVILSTDKLPLRDRQQIALLVLLGYRAGLRFSEAYGLLRQDILYEEKLQVIVSPNITRGIKTDSSKRYVVVLENLTDQEGLLLKDYLQSLQTDWDKDDLCPLFIKTLGKRRELISRTHATQVIHFFLRNITGDHTLRYHHFRHSFATRKAFETLKPQEGFKTSPLDRQFNIDLYPLKLIATNLGHADELTTLRSYVHNLDELLVKWLPKQESKLSDHGRAYCQMLKYDSVRKIRSHENKAISFGLSKKKRVVGQFLSPIIKTKPRNLKLAQIEFNNWYTYVSPSEAEQLIHRYATSHLEFVNFSKTVNIPKERQLLIFETAKSVERRSGYSRYQLWNKESSSSNGNHSSSRQKVKLCQSESRQIQKELTELEGNSAHLLKELEQLTETLNIWIKTFYPDRSSNLITQRKESDELIRLFKYVDHHVVMTIYSSSIEQQQGWVANNPTIKTAKRATPRMKEKLGAYSQAQVELRIDNPKRRRAICRVLYVLAVWLEISSLASNQSH